MYIPLLFLFVVVVDDDDDVLDAFGNVPFSRNLGISDALVGYFH